MLIAAIATALLVFGVLFFGYKKKGYSHAQHTISELGEFGSEYARAVNFGLFLPVGVLLFIVAFADFELTMRALLAGCLATGYLVAAFFPCDPGSPNSGSWRQQIHNLGGFVQYAGAAYCLFRLGEEGFTMNGISYRLLGYLLIACIVLVSIPSNPIRGLSQRIAEAIILACLLQLYAS